MTTVPLLAVLAAAPASAAPRTCISSASVPEPFLGTRARLRLRIAPRGVACALRRRPSKYKVANVASRALLSCLVSLFSR